MKKRIEKAADKSQKFRVILNGRHSIMMLYSLLLSFVFLLICTKSSPLYPFNDWVDSNAFFTMGKGMMQGKVLYRDLFEQKGPYLYFIHGLAYLLSSRSFLGVYVFEVISFAVFLFFCYRIFSLFLKAEYTFISLPVLAAVVLNLKSFSHGDSAEEFSLPFLAISLYYLLHYFRNTYPGQIQYRVFLVNGIIAGIILWIKYSLLGFWVGWTVSLGICMIVNKQWMRTVWGALLFLAGMLIATMPWLIYFDMHHAVSAWIDTYVLFNAKYYSVHYSFLQRIGVAAGKLYLNVSGYPLFAVIFCLGVVFLLLNRYLASFMGRAAILLSFLFLMFGVYGGGRSFVYYFEIISPFVLFGLIVLMDFLSSRLHSRHTLLISLGAMLLSVGFTFGFNHNLYMLKMKKADLVQYRFAAVINRTKHATLLNYNCLDSGFYTTSGITPNLKYFERQNIDYKQYPVNMDEQNRYIREKKVDYVVTRGSLLPLKRMVPNFFKNYRLVSRQKQFYEGRRIQYWLFKKRQLL